MKAKRILFFLLLTVGALILTACAEKPPEYYTVTFNSEGGGDYQSRVVKSGELIAEPQLPARSGYTFLGWYSGDAEWNFETDTVTGDVTLTAQWKRITYTVTFDSDGGSSVESQTVPSGDYASEPTAPTKQNHRFIGWYYDDAEWNFEAYRVTDYLTLTAKWEPYATYTVAFDTDGGSYVEPQYITEGDKCTEPQVPTKKNSEFLGWYLNGTKYDFGSAVTGNITLTAKWETVPTFTVLFESNGGSQVAAQYIIQNGLATKPSAPSHDRLAKFVGWFYGDDEWNFDTPITKDIKLVAKWINVYTVTFDTDGAGTLDKIYVDDGDKIPKQKALAKENCEFSGWYFNGTEWNFDNAVTSDMTLKAKWISKPTYTVTFDLAGGLGTENAQYIIEGKKITEPQSPTKTDNKFLGWYLGDEKWDFNADTVTDNITLTARWKNIKFTVTFDFDGGYVTAATQYVLEGNKVAKPQAPTKTEHRFLGWYLGDEEWNFDENTVTHDVTLKAKWQRQVTVTFKVGDTVYDTRTVDAGSVIQTGPAEPTTDIEDYIFNGWVDADGRKWDFGSDTVTENITLTAKFDEYIVVSFITGRGEGITEISYQIKVVKGCTIPKQETPYSPTENGRNYLFSGWYLLGSDIEIKDLESYVVTKPITLKARYSLLSTIVPLQKSEADEEEN